MCRWKTQLLQALLIKVWLCVCLSVRHLCCSLPPVQAKTHMNTSPWFRVSMRCCWTNKIHSLLEMDKNASVCVLHIFSTSPQGKEEWPVFSWTIISNISFLEVFFWNGYSLNHYSLHLSPLHMANKLQMSMFNSTRSHVVCFSERMVFSTAVTIE